MARKGKKSATAARLEAEARELGKRFDTLLAQAREIELAVRQSAKRFRDTA
jgi:hypothetical protein